MLLLFDTIVDTIIHTIKYGGIVMSFFDDN